MNKEGTKKVVHYTEVFSEIIIGEFAFVFPVDHYNHARVSNDSCVATSIVVDHDSKTGIFETLNTLYKPLDEL